MFPPGPELVPEAERWLRQALPWRAAPARRKSHVSVETRNKELDGNLFSRKKPQGHISVCPSRKDNASTLVSRPPVYTFGSKAPGAQAGTGTLASAGISQWLQNTRPALQLNGIRVITVLLAPSLYVPRNTSLMTVMAPRHIPESFGALGATGVSGDERVPPGGEQRTPT